MLKNIHAIYTHKILLAKYTELKNPVMNYIFIYFLSFDY